MAKEIRFQRPYLYPEQEAAIFDPARIVTIEASTKAGKTVGCLAWFIEQGLKGEPGWNYWWVAPVFSQSEIAFRRCWNYLSPIKSVCKRNQSSMYITLPNQVRLWFKSGDRPDDLYGEDVYAAVLDEASRMREESWHAIRSTLTYTRGPVRIIGNVRGRKNWFYKLARLAEEGTPEMAFHRITAYMAVRAGVLASDEVDSAKRDFERLGQIEVFRQLYEAEALDDATNPFGLKAIAECCDDVTGYSQNRAIYAGVDLAGRGAVNIEQVGDAESRDWTAICAFDKTGHLTYLDRFRKPHRETMNEIVRVIGRTKALVDSTGTGDALVEDLQRRGDMQVLGFTFSERSRQDLLEGLALAIQEGSLRWPDERTTDGKSSLREELEAFEFVYTPKGVRYSVQAGSDDLVMAVALAVKRRGKIRNPMSLTAIPKQGLWKTADGEQQPALVMNERPVSQPEEGERAPQGPLVIATMAPSRWQEAG